MIGVYKLTARNGYKTCQPCAAAALGSLRRGTVATSETRAKISAATKGCVRPTLSAEQKIASSRPYIPMICKTCGVEHLRRKDQAYRWSGSCRSCASKATAALPHMKAIQRANGLRTPPDRSKVNEANLRRGPANNKWRGGITPESNRVRNSPEMKAWRAAVFARDNHTCVACGKRGGDKHADHIKPFALHPDLRFDVDNGRTLCVPCHRIYGALVCNGKITRAPTLEFEQAA